MSKVYKRNEIVLGEEKVVKLQINQILKHNENENLDKQKDDQVQVNEQISKNAEAIMDKAKKDADSLLENVELECNEILSKTQEEREAIIAEAYTKASEILEAAREEGYNKGIVQGQETGLKEVDSIIEEAKEIKENALLEKKAMAKSLENEIVELVISCVKKVLNYELEREHSLLLNLVEKGIEKCTYTDSLIIRVSTNDHEIVNSSKNKIYMMTEGIDTIEVKKDPALETGSIIIETTSGTVDASIQTQIAQIEQTFHDILKGE